MSDFDTDELEPAVSSQPAEEAENPRPSPRPRARPRTKPASADRPRNGDLLEEAFGDTDGGYNPFDHVNPKPAGIEVTRTATHPAHAATKLGTGLCPGGPLPLSPAYKSIVQSRWGGGSYIADAVDSSGKSKTVIFELPGESYPLMPEDEDEGDDDLFRSWRGAAPPPAVDAWGRPVIPPQGYGGGYGYGGGSGGGSWMTSAFSERSRRESDELRAQIAELRRDLQQARERADRYREDLERTRREAEVARIEGNHQRAMAELKLELMGRGAAEEGPKGGAMGEVLRSMAAMTNAAMRGAVERKGPDTLEIARTVKELLPSQSSSLSQIKEIVSVVEMIRGLSGGEGGDDSWQGVARGAVREIAPAIAERLSSLGVEGAPPRQQQVQTRQIEAQNVQTVQQQPQPQPQQLPGPPWIKILAEIMGYFENKNSPKIAASHFRTFYRALPDWGGPHKKAEILQGLPYATARVLAAQARKLAEAMPPELKAEAEVALKFADVAEDQTGGAEWINAFLREFADNS